MERDVSELNFGFRIRHLKYIALQLMRLGHNIYDRQGMLSRMIEEEEEEEEEKDKEDEKDEDDVCMYKGWAFTALAPRPTVVYCA
jgi:hypothetical protein